MNENGDKTLRLEMLVTEHERLLDQFSDLIQDQQAQISQLKQAVQSIERRLAEQDEPGTDALADEPPPHY